MGFDYSPWLRPEMMPNIWCPGCGVGIIVKSFIRAVEGCGWNRDDTALVSGIGCTSRAPGYVDMNTLHTTHGRALTFATGIKLVAPDKNVAVISGDGDAAAIGGNHLIHSCRRNIDITLVIVNNGIYGMTGGQYSPTSPSETRAATSPYGNLDQAFDLCNLSIAAGATYVARGHVANAVFLERLIKNGLQHKGFAVIEVMANCHTQYGRRNRHPDPAELIQFIGSRAVPAAAWAKLSVEERSDKFPVGVLHKDTVKPEYTAAYRQIQERAMERARQTAEKHAEKEKSKPVTQA
ncbi:2-oxoacid:ferredoxin oxidoreductase subunit beta [bacterium]|nr:2-oxoacid:ferredoxin oxidoreductase subunit beta [bacterium]MBU1985359.1 2-oxoacid:ferredoxin oxidoreductase subunit beta [bacterium]